MTQRFAGLSEASETKLIALDLVKSTLGNYREPPAAI
jgi:hypothetical protein